MACIRTDENQWENNPTAGQGVKTGGQKNIIQIYTDWANHYLEKGKSKRRIQNLQNDVIDGVVISDVIEAVTGHKVADVNRKPKTRSQMLQNVNLCLTHLRSLGVPVEEVQGEDIIDGKLKPILGLFFQLSRHKQQQQKQRKPRAEMATPQSSIKAPASGGIGKSSGISCIPSSASRDRQTPDNRAKQSLLQKPGSAASSRSGSPTSLSGSRTRTSSQRSGLSTPSMMRAGQKTSQQPNGSVRGSQGKAGVSPAASPANRDRAKTKTGANSLIKRTSSSSGVSSSRSDSSSSVTNHRTDSQTPITSSSSGVATEALSGPSPRQQQPEGYGSLSRKSGGGRSLLQAPQARLRAGATAATSNVKRRSLLGSQSSLASVGTNASGSAIPKPGGMRVQPPTVPSGSDSRRHSLAERTGAQGTAAPSEGSGSSIPALSAGDNRRHSLAERTGEQGSVSGARGEGDTATAGQMRKGSTADSKLPSSDSRLPSAESRLPSAESRLPASESRLSSAESRLPTAESRLPSVESRLPSVQERVTPVDDAEVNNRIGSVSRESSATPQTLANTESDATECDTEVGESDSAVEGAPSGRGGEKGVIQLPRQRQLGQARSGQGVSVAMVSPMPHTPEVETKPRLSAGGVTSPVHIADSNNQEKQDSPVVSPEQQKDRRQEKDPPVEDVDVYSLRPMEPILRLSHYAAGRGAALASSRRPQPPNSFNTSYGYMSDSEAMSEDVRYDSVMDGYMSEDGLYARSPVQVKYSRSAGCGGEESVLWKLGSIVDSVTLARMSADRSPAAYYSYTDTPGTSFLKQKAAREQDQARFSKKEQSSEYKSVSSGGPWRRGAGDSRPRGQYSGPPGPSPSPARDGRTTGAPTTGGTTKLKQENGADVEPESPMSKLSRQRLRRPAASAESRRPASQTSVSSGGSARDPGPGQLPPAAGDGSLSDTAPEQRRQAGQPRPSSAYTAYSAQQQQQTAKTYRGSMTDAESMESLSSATSLGAAQLPQQQQRSSSLTYNRLLQYQWAEGPGPGSSAPLSSSPPPVSRSNSVRSTKSEKLYNNLLQRGGSEEDPYYTALLSEAERERERERDSPTPSSSRASYPLQSPCSTGRASFTTGSIGRGTRADDDPHGSSLSLVSTNSSIYSAHEEKQASEARRLRRELNEAQEKVQTLTNQLTTNAHVVEAFEQSLTSMTKKLHQTTLTCDQKDRELAELRRQLARLLTPAGGPHNYQLRRAPSSDSLSSQGSACSAQSQPTGTSCGLGSSLAGPHTGATPDSPGTKKKKKKGWFSASPQLRSSFGKAFSRKKSRAGSDVEDVLSSAPSSPVPVLRHSTGSEPTPTAAADRLTDKLEEDPLAHCTEEELRRQLREKDTALTDMRLEALSSHHQLETLKETIGRIRREMACLRQDNERLQRLVVSRSANSSRTSLAAEPGEKPPAVTSLTSETVAPPGGDERKLTVTVRLAGGPEGAPEPCPVGSVTVARKTSWQTLDDALRRTFKEYLTRLDPDQGLGIDSDSIVSYTLGEVTRTPSTEGPELLPWGYTVGDVSQTQVTLRGTTEGCVDAFVFETLIPKPIVHRYVSMLLEHRRVILCGQSGTGKTYLAHRLADYLVGRSGDPSPGGSGEVATVTVEPGGGRQLHQYLTQLAERCRQAGDSPLPQVLILDNLHHVPALSDVFNGFLSTAHTDPRCPYIIGTMSQPAGGPATGLQLHHNFRWVLCANHVEPVRGFLSRHLRRRLVAAELTADGADTRLRAVFDWLPRVWQQLNKFLETHSSTEVTMGPRLLLNCPADLTASQVWFTDVWNYSIVPYLLETVREGLLIYGRRASWQDPAQFVLDTYPWPRGVAPGPDALARLRPEDVGYSSVPPSTSTPQIANTTEVRPYKDADPLLSMLLSLQEAANYTSSTGISGSRRHPGSVAVTPEGQREVRRRPPGGPAGQATI